MNYFPKFEKMIETGDIEPSTLEKLSNKLTRANEDIIAKNIVGKSAREVEAFVSRVTNCGKILNVEEEKVEVKLDFPREVYDKLVRARKILGQNKKSLSLEDVIDQAVDALLDKKDPVRKAERAKHREKKKEQKATSLGKEHETVNMEVKVCNGDLSHQLKISC